MGSQSVVDNNYIKKHIQNSVEIKQRVLADNSLLNELDVVANLCVDAFKSGNKIILAGNGGSAADAQHIAAEFVSRFRFDRPGLPSLSLSTDTSMLTAIGNDYGYDKLFARQLQANGKSGDVFIGISTSGNSKNVLEAVHVAKELGVTSVGMTGGTGGLLRNSCDHLLLVPSDSTALIQEVHIMLGHIICGYVEDTLFSEA